MNDALQAADINTSRRLAHWLAQVGHESGRLRWMRELWGPTPAQRRYEPVTTLSARLGNTRAGDGKRFMGRGLIQVTGRYNYRAATQRLKRLIGANVPDFEAAPILLESLDWAAMSAADYWVHRKLNAFADADDTYTLTRRINGGTNGLADRQALLASAMAALRGL
jgi:putative chitinase